MSEPIHLPVIASALGDAIRERGEARCRVDAFEALPSTSRWLTHRLRTGEAGERFTELPWLCLVDRQTDGVGRRGKRWHSEPGNVTFSLASAVDLPAARLTALGLVTGIGIAEVLQATIAPGIAIKWPNDLVLDGRKLGGILIELLGDEKGTISRVVVGVGINYRQTRFDHADGLDGVGLAELAAELPEREALVATLVRQLLVDQRRYARTGWSAFAARWREIDALAGQVIDVHRGGTRRAAHVHGVRDDGALLVSWSDGTHDALISGEVSVRPSRRRA